MRFNGYYCTSKKVAGASGYNPEDNKLKGKGDGGEVVMITREGLVELERKEKIFDEMLKVYQEGGKGGKGVRTSTEKSKGHTDIVQASTEQEPELLPEEDIQKPVWGHQMYCL